MAPNIYHLRLSPFASRIAFRVGDLGTHPNPSAPHSLFCASPLLEAHAAC